MNRIGIFGGTFDPIHLGHLITAQAVKEIRGLEKIIFVPSYTSPHKTDIISSTPLHRLEMLKLAIQNINYFEFSYFEIKNEAISYTIDTLNKLKKKHKEIELIIGYDNLLEFSTWKEPDEILNIAKLIVLSRRVEKIPAKKDQYFNSAIFVKTPVIEISGSEIRRRVKEDLPINFLVPEIVKEYIYNFNLYKE